MKQLIANCDILGTTQLAEGILGGVRWALPPRPWNHTIIRFLLFMQVDQRKMSTAVSNKKVVDGNLVDEVS